MTYGCYNRDDFKKSYIVFDGYVDVYRTVVHTIPIENRMTMDCQYSKDTIDPECEGCKRNQRNAVIEEVS